MEFGGFVGFVLSRWCATFGMRWCVICGLFFVILICWCSRPCSWSCSCCCSAMCLVVLFVFWVFCIISIWCWGFLFRLLCLVWFLLVLGWLMICRRVLLIVFVCCWSCSWLCWLVVLLVILFVMCWCFWWCLLWALLLGFVFMVVSCVGCWLRFCCLVLAIRSVGFRFILVCWWSWWRWLIWLVSCGCSCLLLTRRGCSIMDVILGRTCGRWFCGWLVSRSCLLCWFFVGLFVLVIDLMVLMRMDWLLNWLLGLLLCFVVVMYDRLELGFGEWDDW